MLLFRISIWLSISSSRDKNNPRICRYKALSVGAALSTSCNCSAVARKAGSAIFASFVTSPPPPGEPLQHSPAADTQQITDQTGQFNPGVFQQRFDLTVDPHAVAR